MHCQQGTYQLVFKNPANAQGAQAAMTWLYGQRVPDCVSAAAPPASWRFIACTWPQESPPIRSGTWAVTLNNCRLFKDCLHDPARKPVGISWLVQGPEKAHHITPPTSFESWASYLSNSKLLTLRLHSPAHLPAGCSWLVQCPEPHGR